MKNRSLKDSGREVFARSLVPSPATHLDPGGFDSLYALLQAPGP